MCFKLSLCSWILSLGSWTVKGTLLSLLYSKKQGIYLNTVEGLPHAVWGIIVLDPGASSMTGQQTDNQDHLMDWYFGPCWSLTQDTTFRHEMWWRPHGGRHGQSEKDDLRLHQGCRWICSKGSSSCLFKVIIVGILKGQFFFVTQKVGKSQPWFEEVRILWSFLREGIFLFQDSWTITRQYLGT